MISSDIRKKYLEFFEKRGHTIIPPAKLVLENDSTTLFTSSGMQPLIPYLLGEKHPKGKKLVDSQPSFRSEDIDEIGDNRHTTFFEMLGNWSLGDYFKEEQIDYVFSLLINEFNIDPTRIYATLFKGSNIIPKDTESELILKTQYNQLLGYFHNIGVSNITVNEDPEKGIILTDRIFYYTNKNWWSRSGSPENMPVGEIGGSDVEIFYDFGTPHDEKFGSNCHPNCDCGRFMEICNSVFIQYQKQGDGYFIELPQRNVDFGGGLERLVAAANKEPDIFKTDLYQSIIEVIEGAVGKKYQEEENKSNIRIIADHMKAATFLIYSGVTPSNKLHGYILRRLLRRSAVKFYSLTKDMKFLYEMIKVYNAILDIYDGLFGIDKKDLIRQEENYKIIFDEMDKFGKTLSNGFHLMDKLNQVDGKVAFDLYQSYGFPLEITAELVKLRGYDIDREQFEAEFRKHQELSRSASAGKFAGGLAGHSDIEIKYHTATHLLHQVLRDVLGETVFQKGSNITPERLRFDFSFDRKMSDKEIKEVEDLVNKKIKEDLKVDRKYMTYEEAKALNAIGLFDDKYDKSNVSIYCIGPEYTLDPDSKDTRARGGYYSLEFCGGPHVEHTAVIGGIKITKEEAVSGGVRRIRAQLSTA